jgi:lysozyme family protein
MKENFEPALALVLRSEGGFVNNPRDPGGATCKGVTQAVYDDWRRGHGMGPQSVRGISSIEVSSIYRQNYWNRVHGDDLPAGVDYATFDLAVNSGPARAARFLQSAAGVAEDGAIGPATIAAVRADPRHVVEVLLDRRLAFLKTLPTFDTFGRGWTVRCGDVRKAALEMAT